MKWIGLITVLVTIVLQMGDFDPVVSIAQIKYL